MKTTAKTKSKTFQTGWIQELKRDGGWTAFKLYWRERQPGGKWATKTKTLPRETEDGQRMTKTLAKAELSRLMQKVNEQNSTAPTSVRGKHTFKTLVDTHWAFYVQNQGMRPGTVDAYNVMLGKWIRPFFENVAEVSKVEPAFITEFMSKLMAEGLSAKYRKNIYNLLTLIFDLAVQNDLIVISPIRPKLHRPTVRRKEKPTLDPTICMKLLQAISEIDGPMGRMYALATLTLMLTGMRQGELLGLRWMNADFDGRVLMKTHVLYRGQLLEGMKNTSGDGKIREHLLPMSEPLFKALSITLAMNPHKEPTAFVFCQPDGKPLNPDHYRNYVLYPAMDKLGIKREKGTHGLHLFRHTAGSLVYNSTGSMKAAQEQLGHANMQTTANIYVHTDHEQKEKAANALAAAFPLLLLESATFDATFSD